jgi:hypothetical protein
MFVYLIVFKLWYFIVFIGLMIKMTPENCKKDLTKRKKWKKYNIHFDESIIKVYENHLSQIKRDLILKYMQNKN